MDAKETTEHLQSAMKRVRDRAILDAALRESMLKAIIETCRVMAESHDLPPHERKRMAGHMKALEEFASQYSAVR